MKLQKFDEVERRILELESAILDFNNSNLNTINNLNYSTHNLLKNSFLLIRYFDIIDSSHSSTISDLKSIRNMSLKSIEAIKVASSEICNETNLLSLNSNNLNKLIQS